MIEENTSESVCSDKREELERREEDYKKNISRLEETLADFDKTFNHKK